MYHLLYVVLWCYIQKYNVRYSTKFYPEKRNGVTANVPVMLSVTFSKQRMFYYTGLRCRIEPDKNQWDAETGQLKRNQTTPDGLTSTDFNSELTKITDHINDLFKAYEVGNVSPTTEQLREDLKRKLHKKTKAKLKADFYSRYDQYIIDSGLSDNRKITLQSIGKKLKAYNPGMTFDNIDLPGFKNYMSETLCRNSIAFFLNGFKTFIKHSIKESYTSINPFDSFEYAGETYGKPIYLTIPERDILFNATIKDKHLSMIRDIFCLQCFLGCRYGDLMRFTKGNINNGVLSYIAAKTKNDDTRIANVPLSEKAKQIISRYDLPDGRLLPFVKVDDCNYYIKILFRNVGIIRNVTVMDKKTQLEKIVAIDTMASTHMARRIFVGSLFKAGVNNEVIGSMSGHVAHSKAISRYYAVDSDQQKAAMKLIE